MSKRSNDFVDVDTITRVALLAVVVLATVLVPVVILVSALVPVVAMTVLSDVVGPGSSVEVACALVVVI